MKASIETTGKWPWYRFTWRYSALMEIRPWLRSLTRDPSSMQPLHLHTEWRSYRTFLKPYPTNPTRYTTCTRVAPIKISSLGNDSAENLTNCILQGTRERGSLAPMVIIWGNDFYFCRQDTIFNLPCSWIEVGFETDVIPAIWNSSIPSYCFSVRNLLLVFSYSYNITCFARRASWSSW